MLVSARTFIRGLCQGNRLSVGDVEAGEHKRRKSCAARWALSKCQGLCSTSAAQEDTEGEERLDNRFSSWRPVRGTVGSSCLFFH